jgi:hypothetical protein
MHLTEGNLTIILYCTIFCIPVGTGGSFPGVKRTGREVDHSPPTSVEVKKMWIYTSTPIRLHGVVLNYLSTGTTLPYHLLHIRL